MKVMVSFPDEFLAEVDRIAAAENRTRSELLREAVRIYIETKETRKRPIDDPKVRRAVEVLDEISRRSPGRGEDSTEDIRRWREARR